MGKIGPPHVHPLMRLPLLNLFTNFSLTALDPCKKNHPPRDFNLCAGLTEGTLKEETITE